MDDTINLRDKEYTNRELMKEMGLENFDVNFDAKKLKKVESSNKCEIY